MANHRIALPGQLVYLGGPMSGLPFDECRKWRDKACKFLSKLRDARSGDYLYHVLNPLRGHVNLVDCTPCYDDASAERADIRRDRYDVARSDIVLADLSDTMKLEIPRASVGTICELDQAHLQGKFIIVVMTEDNPHWHSFIKDMAAVVFPTLDGALQYMKLVLNVAMIEE